MAEKKSSSEGVDLDLQSLPKKEQVELLKLANEVVLRVTDSLLLQDEITIEGDSADKIYESINKHLVSAINDEKVDFPIVIDHTTELLANARRSVRAEDYDIASL
jgi:hypothetical protein